MKNFKNKTLLKRTVQVFAVVVMATSFEAPAEAQIFNKMSKATADFFKKFSKKDSKTDSTKSQADSAQASPVSSVDIGASVGEKIIATAFTHILVAENNFYVKANAGSLKVDQVITDSHTEIVPEYSDSGLKFVIHYDQTALDNPSLLIKDLALVSAITNSLDGSAIFTSSIGFISPHTQAELLTNLKEGSLTAKAQWLEVQVNLLKGIQIRPEFAELYKLNTNILTEAISSLQEKAQNAAIEASDYTKKQQKAYDKWKSETGALNKLDALNEKLDDLMMKNDRKGVKKLIESYLPWTLMEPVEANTWKIWLEAIENPDPNNSSIAFRGLDYTTDKLKRAEAENGEIYGFMAPVLTKNQGNYNRRLRSLSTNRIKNGDRVFNTDQGISSKSIRIIDQMIAHSRNPIASSFISFTFNPVVARVFAGTTAKKQINGQTKEVPWGGLLVVKMDNRRLVPNLPSAWINEIELLTPLLVFPDEIIDYREYLNSDASYLTFIEEIAKKTGTNFKDWQSATKDDGKIYKEFYKNFGFSFFRKMMSVERKGNSCIKLFESQTP